jgi:hypothetical protein
VEPVNSAPRSPGIIARHPELRCLFSVVLIVAAIATFTSYVSGAFRDHDSGLSATGPEQVVSQVRATHTGGYSGTILAKVDLGLPSGVTTMLARLLPYGGALLSGSHTLRYWYGGQSKQRIAILEQNAEQDVFRNGHQLTLWSSATRTFERHGIDQANGPLPPSAAPAAALTPPLLAQMVLATAAPERTTTLRSGELVAGRPTYELVVQPTTSKSLIGSVHIQIDGKQAVPLAVQVYPRGSATAAIDIAFTSISYSRPEQRNFSFAPPPTAQSSVTTLLRAGDITTVHGGWLTLLELPTSALIAATVDRAFGASMLRVQKKWGAARMYSAGMLSVLTTNKGQVVVGAVAPRVLYASVAR